MSILAHNLAALERHYPAFKRLLMREHARADAWEIVRAKSGLPTAKMGGHFVHSGHDPLREAEKVIAAYVDEATSAYVLYGFGLGYYVEALQRRISEHTEVYVVIDNGDRFWSALATRPLQQLLARGRTHYLWRVSGGALVQLVQHIDNSALQIIDIRSISRTNQTYFSTLDDEMQRLRQRRAGNINTTRRFGHLWIANCMRNMSRIVRSVDCAQARGTAGGRAVLLVAAGPSLDDCRDLLPQWAQRMCVIAVDTACNALMRAGVEPDVIIAVDAQYWNSRHLDGHRYRNTVLVYDPCVCPRVLRQEYRQTIVFSTAVPIVRWLQDYLALQPSLAGGGTVTAIGWEFARWIGATDIYLAGVDFGYPRRKIHCTHCFFEERMAARNQLLHSLETQYHRYLCASPLEQTNDYDARSLLSDYRLAIYARWFEEHLGRYPRVRTMTLNDQSRQLEHVTAAGAVERLPDTRADTQRWLQSLAAAPTIRAQTTAAALATLKSDTDCLRATAREIYAHSRPPGDNQDSDAGWRRALAHNIAAAPISNSAKEVLRAALGREAPVGDRYYNAASAITRILGRLSIPNLHD